MRHRAPRRVGPSPRWGWAAAGLAALAVGCSVLAVMSPHSASVAGATQRTEPPRPTLSPSPVRPASSSPAPVVAGAPPVRIRIPAIEVSARVDHLGLNPDETVEVPTDPMRTGWYRLGPPPGDPGSAVVLGHVDSVSGTAVFGRLRDLRPGDLVVVEAADGTTSTFRVTRLVTYANADFPAEHVYAAPGSGRRLNLVTCGGRYTRETGHQANLVVYTRLVQPPTGPSASRPQRRTGA